MKTFAKLAINYCTLLFAFTALVIWAYSIPNDAIRKNVIESARVFQKEGLYKKFFNFKLFQMDNFTDCYMMNLAISGDDGKPVESAMMNYDYKSKNFMALASDTEKIASGDTTNLEKHSYGRYWQGYQTTLRPVLTMLDYTGIRVLNYILFAALLTVCLCLMGKTISAKVALLFGISLIAINFPIVPLSLQFSTCFYIALIGMILVMKYPRLTQGANLYCTFFTLGAVTSFMDFLTTPQLTLGLPLIIYLLTRGGKEKGWKTVIILSVVWAMGYGLLWASKWMTGYLLTGNNILADAMQSAELRSSNLYKGMEMTIPNIICFIWTNIQTKHLTGLFYLGLAVLVVLAFVYIRIMKGKQSVKDYGWLLLVAMIVPVWFLALRNHSIQHGWFTWRAGLLSLFSLMLFIYYTTDIKKLFHKSKKP